MADKQIGWKASAQTKIQLVVPCLWGNEEDQIEARCVHWMTVPILEHFFVLLLSFGNIPRKYGLRFGWRYNERIEIWVYLWWKSFEISWQDLQAIAFLQLPQNATVTVPRRISKSFFLLKSFQKQSLPEILWSSASSFTPFALRIL